MTQTEFDALTPEQKRIAIAEDVVRHVTNKSMRVCCSVRIELDSDCVDVDTVAIQQSDVTAIMPHCHVCAKGALLLARLERFGGLIDLDAANEDDCDLIEPLREYFDVKQLYLIEAAFEVSLFDWHYEHSGELEDVGEWDEEYVLGPDDQSLFDRAVAFGAKYRNSDDRLLAIMQNLIANGGTFIP